MLIGMKKGKSRQFSAVWHKFIPEGSDIRHRTGFEMNNEFNAKMLQKLQLSLKKRVITSVNKQSCILGIFGLSSRAHLPSYVFSASFEILPKKYNSTLSLKPHR